MRKFLLFGTMLGMASAALAFGGMFNHGNKSTTYKGGVDAIGVHFGGEKKTDSQPEEETCPDGVTKDNNGYCGLCDNGNLYFPYRENPCAEETPINKIHCESDEDCEEGCCSANGWCANAWFLSCGTDRTCLSNNDCESGEFCNLNHSGNYSGVRWPGVCSNIGPKREIEYNNKTFVQSTELSTSFLGAANWCHAQGLEMATSADLGIDVNLVCYPWGEVHCDNIDFSAFKGLEEDYFSKCWLNDGMKLYKEVFNEDLNEEVFRLVDPFYERLLWSPDNGEDSECANGALCK